MNIRGSRGADSSPFSLPVRDCAGATIEVGKSVKEESKGARNSPNSLSSPCFNCLLLVTNLQKTHLFCYVFSIHIYFFFKILPPPFDYFTADWNSFISAK